MKSASKTNKASKTAKRVAPVGNALAAYDDRPFFEKALAHALQQNLLSDEKLQAIRIEGAKGMVQIADFFGTAFLRGNLELARSRIVALASLYLEQFSQGDLSKAAYSLRDNSFLSHSRGGSDLLKALYAMPGSTVFGDTEQGSIKDFLAEWSQYGTHIFANYQALLKQRKEYVLYLGAAAWYAERMGVERGTLAYHSADERYMCSAEGVIRTAILQRLAKTAECPNRADFARLIMNLRSKGLSAKAKKTLLTLPADLPDDYRPIEAAISQHIEQYDLVKIADAEIPVEVLLNTLEARYYLRSTGIEEVSEYDAMVSAAWHKIMKGKSEPDARLTVFLCLAAGVAAKVSLTEVQARSVIRAVRTQGLDSAVVLKFIEESAPYDLRESLIELWQREFVPEAEVALFDPRDEKLAGALRFLKENCRVTTPVDKKKTSL